MNSDPLDVFSPEMEAEVCRRVIGDRRLGYPHEMAVPPAQD